MASDYCAVHDKGIAGTRNPIPDYDAFTSAERGSPSGRNATGEDEPMALDLPTELPSTVLRMLPSAMLEEDLMGELPEESGDSGVTSHGNEQDAPIPSLQRQESGSHGSVSTSPVQAPATGAKAEPDKDKEQTPVAKEDLDEERAKLRSSLIDRCLDVIGAHPDTTYEVSELITSVVMRSPGDDLSTRQEIGETLVNALMSFAMDEDLKSNGRSIAAYAHLLSLLLQEKSFLKATIGVLKENVTEFLRFLHIPGSTSSDELAPWIPYVLLVFEILLSDDEQLGEIRWKAPELDSDPIEPLEWAPKDLNVKKEDRQTLLRSILEILPRIGKEESLAVSVLRILVILTRDRTIARLVGDKKNLQRLFVTAKQLSGVGSVRLSETRISSYILIILRHVVEDEEVIKQIMRSELRTYLENTRNTRPLEPTSFLKNFSNIVLRDPTLFVEITNEMLKLNRWTPRDSNAARHQTIVLKEVQAEATKDEVAPAVRATEDLSIQDIKPSTEGQDKSMDDGGKTATQDSKRPVVETPDGVIHFLLCELLNYREVDDKDQSQLSKEGAQTEEQTSVPSEGAVDDTRVPDGKDRKAKNLFKADEHPIFVYRCFLLHCLTELLQSYNRTKVEFINFKRNAQLFANTPVKPRSSVLNYLLTDLLFPSHMDNSTNSWLYRKKYATAVQTQNLLVALVTRTGEKPVDRNRDKYDYEDEPDLLFVRKFVLDTMLKSYKDATISNDPFDTRYNRMLSLAEVMHLMMGDKDKDPVVSRNSTDSLERSQAQMRRLMYEKGYLAALTASIADIDLAFPPVKRTIKYILRVLRLLTSTAIHLSHSNIIPSVATQDNTEDELISTSSLSDIEDDREETPDLYRNSALGMHEPGRDMDDDYSEDSEDGTPLTYIRTTNDVLTAIDDDEEMYDDEYDDDMGYESEDREEDVSDREDEEGLEGMGPIEGLSGDPGIIEVTMEDDNDDEDEDDDMDEDDEDEESDEDEDSDDMDDVEDRIQIVDDEGNALEDDGASDWESEPDGEEDDEVEIDYEGEAQDLQESGIHLDDVEGLSRFGNIMRAIGEAGDFGPAGSFVPVIENVNELNEMEGMNPRFIAGEGDDGKSP
jgi:E3 ubiquitin-protein ligase HUWE1